jgi:aspartyl-tRNA(Asn)/glutamyl-tRNA(Gln) amidotransferase subunit C
MSVTNEDIRYIAELARLRLDPEEMETIRRDLNNILEYMQKLSGIDTEGVEPLLHVLDMEPVSRPDVANPPLPHEEALKGAPDADSDYFRVPKVLE